MKFLSRKEKIMNATRNKIWRLGILSLFVLNLLLQSTEAAPKKPSFTTIDPPGTSYSGAYGINAAGEIVGFYLDDNGGTHGYLLSQGQFSTIDPPGTTFSSTTGINPAGEIVGVYTDAAFGAHGYLLSHGHFSTIDFPGAFYTDAFSINPAEEIVGYYGDANGALHGFLLSQGHFTTIAPPVHLILVPTVSTLPGRSWVSI
jgi:probable HAF family extracellular repeat protein